MKTKINLIYMSLVILGCKTILSCSDILDTDPPVNQISAYQVFDSVSTADAALAALYIEVQSGSLFSGGVSGAGALLGTYTDDIYCYNNSVQNADLDLYNNIQTPLNTRVKSTWTNAYKEIYMANSIIEGLDRSTSIPENDKNRILGETVFIRSLIFFYLSQIYGDVAYTTTTDYNTNQSLTKTNEAQVLLKIEEDLKESILLMGDTYRNSERIYVNKKTAELLLATVFMNQQRWSEAEVTLKKISNSSLYTWENAVSKCFKNTGKHIIWQLKPLKSGNATNEGPLYNFTTAVPTSYSLSEDLISSFDTHDLRKQNWIKPITINQTIYYKADKYKNISNNTDEYSIVFRLEEVYLLLSEALVQQNKLSEALPYLNSIKQRANIELVPSNYSKEMVLNEIVKENRKEFFTERGIRFITLKRAGLLNTLMATKPNWKNFHQYWPLPNSELILNPKLNPQNDGY